MIKKEDRTVSVLFPSLSLLSLTILSASESVYVCARVSGSWKKVDGHSDPISVPIYPR